MSDEGAERVRAAHPDATWDRLAAIKSRYDPANLFRLNQNIPTAIGRMMFLDSIDQDIAETIVPPSN